MILTSVLQLSLVISGSAPEVAEQLAAYFQQPVAILVEQPQTFRKSTIIDDTKSLLARRVGSTLGLTRTTSGNLGAGQKTWPFYAISRNNIHLRESLFRNFPLQSVDKSKPLASIRANPSKYFELRELSLTKLEKPLDLHWFYQDLVLTADFRYGSEEQQLETIAQAVGAQYKNGGSVYQLNFRPTEFRQRTQGWNIRWTVSKPLEHGQASLKLLAIGLKYLNDQELVKLYMKPGNELRCTIARHSDLDGAAQEKFLSLYGSHIKKMNTSVQRIRDLILSKVDFEQPKDIIFKASDTPSIVLYSHDRKEKFFL